MCLSLSGAVIFRAAPFETFQGESGSLLARRPSFVALRHDVAVCVSWGPPRPSFAIGTDVSATAPLLLRRP